MDERIKRLLRLEAALTDCEGLIVDPKTRGAFNLLAKNLGIELDREIPVWGNFLDAQDAAVASWHFEAKDRLWGTSSAEQIEEK